MALPRLTGSLRAFSGLSADDSEQYVTSEALQRDLFKKRQRYAEQQAQEGLTWSGLVDTVRRHAQGIPEDTVTRTFRGLIDIARDIGKKQSCCALRSTQWNILLNFILPTLVTLSLATLPMPATLSRLITVVAFSFSFVWVTLFL